MTGTSEGDGEGGPVMGVGGMRFAGSSTMEVLDASRHHGKEDCVVLHFVRLAASNRIAMCTRTSNATTT